MNKKADKDIMIYRISKVIIKLAKKYHVSGHDSVGELYNTNLDVSKQIGQEMERIRMKERGEIA